MNLFVLPKPFDGVAQFLIHKDLSILGYTMQALGDLFQLKK
jgi:hypothetical protein